MEVEIEPFFRRISGPRRTTFRLTLDFAVQESVGRQQGNKKGVHASPAILVSLVRGLQNRGVIQGLVATHPEAKGMTDEDLLDPFVGRQSIDHLQRILDRTVESGVPAVNDFPRGIDGLIQFGGSKEAGMVVHLERQAERIHLLVAGPAVFFAGHARKHPARMYWVRPVTSRPR